MYYHPKKLPANEDRIYKQRQYEDALRDRLNSVQKYEHLMLCAEFEQLNEPRTCYRSLTEKLEAIRSQREQLLWERKKKLMQLLEAEDSALNEEMKTGSMNLTERRAWLEAQARTLKMQRLEKDQKYAETQLERAFRDSSDDVRIHNSKVAVMRAEEERKRQREDTMQKRIKEKENEKALYKMMELEWERQDELHHKDIELEKCRKEEAIDILQEQLGMVQRLREEEREAVEEDMKNMTRRWLEDEEALKLRLYEQRCLDAQKAKELLAYNEHNRAKKLSGMQEEKKYDAHMIAMVTEREAEEALQERQLKEAQRREAKAYAAQLKAAIERQKVEDEELEAMIKAEVEEVWQKQDAEIQHQEDIRKRLFDQVHDERQAQLQLKENTRRAQEGEKRIQLEKNQADAVISKLEAQKQAEEAKMSKQELMDVLEAQIRGSKAAELVEQETKRAEFEGTKVAEQKYEVKVKQALTDLPYPEPWYGRKSVKWYE